MLNILGKPFLATGKTLIDMKKMRIDHKEFIVLDSMKSFDGVEDYNFVNALDFAITDRLNSVVVKKKKAKNI